MSVSRLIALRLASMLPMLFLISLVAFLLVAILPGDPASVRLGESATPEAIAALREELHLDDPLLVRYERWVVEALQGNLGDSLETRQPVLPTIIARLPVTLALAVSTIIVAIALGVVGGMIAGYRAGSKLDKALSFAAGAVLAVPDFWVGLLLIAAVLQTQLLPTVGYVALTSDPGSWLEHMVLPVITLALHPTAELFRQTRAAVADVMRLDFVRTLWAGGVSWGHILFVHVGKNAMIAVLTVLGLQLGRLIGQTALVETIFGMNGLGSLVVQAALSSDVVTVQAVVLFTGALVLVINLVIDVAYLYLNPRLRTA